MKRSSARYWILGGWFGVIVVYQIWAWTHGLTPRQSAISLVDEMRSSRWGPLLFIGAELIRPLLLLSAAMLTIGAAFLYGPVFGLFLVVIATNASALIAYSVGRLFRHGGPHADQGDTRIARYRSRLQSRSFETIATLRLIFMPYDLVSYACGIARVRPLVFFAATALGSLPGTITFVMFGASLERLTDDTPTISWPLALGSAGMLAVTLTIAHTLHRRERSRTIG